jgi:DNA-binding PadR family transcriptional regulator
VSEIRDHRRRNDLDLFVLALLDAGISTPYDLQHLAGLSPGASIPALRRLAERKLVISGKAGVRGRVGHKPTAAGLRHLQEAWRGLIETGPTGDLDSDLRMAVIALVVGRDRSLATGFLRESAARMRRSAKSMKRTSEATAPLGLADCYRNLRAIAAESLLEGRAAAASKLAGMLPSAPTGQRPRNRKGAQP